MFFYVFSTMQKHKNAYCNSIENMSSLEKSNSSTIYDTALEIKAFIHGSLGVVKNIEFKIVAYLPRFFMLVFVKFYASIYRILLYSAL